MEFGKGLFGRLWLFAGGLRSFVGGLWSFAGGLCSFAGSLCSFTGGLWSLWCFVVVCVRFQSLPVLGTTKLTWSRSSLTTLLMKKLMAKTQLFCRVVSPSLYYLHGQLKSKIFKFTSGIKMQFKVQSNVSGLRWKDWSRNISDA